MAGRIAARLKELQIELPAANPSLANYVPAIRTANVPASQVGNLLYISGQISHATDEVRYLGKLGSEFSVEDGRHAARLCALNILAHVHAALEGDLDRVVRCVRLNGFVNSAPDFIQQHIVMMGASDLMVEIFGEAGRHSRTAIGVASLPLGYAVEVDAIFEVNGGSGR